MTLGSLFDGIGGFPLVASWYGITPLWASEIEPNAISITRRNLPQMVHLGDVTRLDHVPPVDVVTFGSPCQDLSVAGKRAGLDGARSGLFLAAVDIIRRMREETHGKYPTYAVWENVPGAFSSRRGEDFRRVLEELVRIAEPQAVMPPVPPGGWAYADCYAGDGWSLAYRVFDAQHWGVPQRRKRVYLVLDLAGGRAGQILFEPESLRGDLATSQKPWERFAARVGGGAAGEVLHPDVAGTLCASGAGLNRPAGQGNEADLCIVIYDVAQRMIVRRLTPLECERLQGYPDGWTASGADSRPISDTAQYHCLGNSVALPCVDYIMAGIKMYGGITK